MYDVCPMGRNDVCQSSTTTTANIHFDCEFIISFFLFLSLLLPLFLSLRFVCVYKTTSKKARKISLNIVPIHIYQNRTKKPKKYPTMMNRTMMMVLSLAYMMIDHQTEAFFIPNPLHRRTMMQSTTISPWDQRYGVSSSVSSSKSSPPTTTKSLVVLHMNNKNNDINNSIEIRTPSQEEAVNMGIRDWPQQVKFQGTSWSETIPAEQTVIRYILDGSVDMVTTTMTTTATESQSFHGRRRRLEPGNYIEITGPITVQWTCITKEVIVLTPGFEEGGLFLGVVGVVILLFVTLILGSTT